MIAFYILVVIFAVGLWIALAEIFPAIGIMTKNKVKEIFEEEVDE